MQSNQHTGRREDGFRINKKKTLTLKESKLKTWSHQNDLAAATGKKIRLRTANGATDGELVAADQFTIKIRLKDNFGKPFDVVMFKSAITSFEVLA